MATCIIRYSLMWYDGQGFTPYNQILQFGCAFQGGFYPYNGCMIGYITGEEGNIEEAINSLGAYNVIALDETMAVLHILDCIGTSFIDEDEVTKYYGIPIWNEENERMEVPILDEDPGNLPVVSDAEKKRLKVIRKIRNGIYNELTTKLIAAINTSANFAEFRTKVLNYFSSVYKEFEIYYTSTKCMKGCF